MKLYDKELQKNEIIPFQLDLLRNAVRYQKWIIEAIIPFLGNNILEIGAGIGNMSRWLPVREKLIVSEVDSEMILFLKKTIDDFLGKNENVSVLNINLSDDWKNQLMLEELDTIVSFNVMEHVENDGDFFSDLVYLLKKNKSISKKRIITFVPAHNFAYGSIDKTYGHYRRYSMKDLKRLKDLVIPEAEFFCRYFNLVGLLGWFFCGRIMKNKEVDANSIKFFERICPIIKPLDDFLHLKLKVPFGQSIFSVITFD